MVNLFNPRYFTPLIITEMQQAFAKDHQLVLPQFLRQAFLEALLEKITRAHWEHDYVPDEHSFHRARFAFPTRLIAPFVSLVAGPIKLVSAEVLTLGHRDYTILHDDKPQDVIECILPLMPYDERWGGRVVYRTEADASVILPQQNQLSLVRTGKRKRFVQYVNHHVKNNGIMLVVLTFQKSR